MSTVKELRAAAKKMGVPKYYSMSKQELIAHVSYPTCRSDQVMNLKTTRCVNRKGAVGRGILGTECREDQYLNTATNRCVGKVGRKGMRMTREMSGAYMLNPKTGRYVLIEGSVGRKLRGLPPLKKKKTRKAPPRPTRAAPSMRPF
jgi:hypothetical protein